MEELLHPPGYGNTAVAPVPAEKDLFEKLREIDAIIAGSSYPDRFAILAFMKMRFE